MPLNISKEKKVLKLSDNIIIFREKFKTATEMSQKGLEFYNNGNYLEAINMFKNAINKILMITLITKT